MRFSLFVFLAFTSSLVFGQSDSAKSEADNTPAYQKNTHIPTFSIRTPDSSWFFQNQLKDDKPTLILYFSPDCGHCQIETEEILSKINKLTNLQIVMITSRPFEDMKNFAEHYKIHRFPTIVIGTDPGYRITKFYAVRTTPYSALYDKRGNFVKEYRKGIDYDDLISRVRNFK